MRTSARHPLAWIDQELDELQSLGLRRHLRTADHSQGPLLRIAGREIINFGSNDYLGLAGDPRVLAAAADAATVRSGSGASPLVTGYSSLHAELERRLAELMGTERALVFSSGYAANLGVIAAMAGPEDAIFSDANNHASIIDGCRLSRASVHIYPHVDWQVLEELLRAETRAKRRLIVTESIFSMQGDAAPLVELADLAQRYDCMLMVDEAHALGVVGANGRGLAEVLEVEPAVHIRVGTLSKAIGAAGGIVAGSGLLVEWLINRARPFVFSTALPPVTCAAALAAIEIIATEPQRRQQLRKRVQQLHRELHRRGRKLKHNQSHIVPLYAADAEAACAWSANLLDRGYLLPAIRPPSVPSTEPLLRLSLTSQHTPQMVEGLCLALFS